MIKSYYFVNVHFQVTPSVPVQINFTFFEVTNPDEVSANVKPILRGKAWMPFPHFHFPRKGSLHLH